MPFYVFACKYSMTLHECDVLYHLPGLRSPWLRSSTDWAFVYKHVRISCGFADLQVCIFELMLVRVMQVCDAKLFGGLECECWHIRVNSLSKASALHCVHYLFAWHWWAEMGSSLWHPSRCAMTNMPCSVVLHMTGGYGGTASEPPKYTFEYPAKWKPDIPSKVISACFLYLRHPCVCNSAGQMLYYKGIKTVHAVKTLLVIVIKLPQLS